MKRDEFTHLVEQPVASHKQPSNRLYHVNGYKNNWSYYLAEYEQNTNSYCDATL